MKFAGEPSLLQRINTAESVADKKRLDVTRVKSSNYSNHRYGISREPGGSVQNSGTNPALLVDRMKLKKNLVHCKGEDTYRTNGRLMSADGPQRGQMEVRGLVKQNVRPFSAPGEAPRRGRQRPIKSAKVREEASTSDMFKLVERAKFEKETEDKRTHDQQPPEDKHEAAPIFNKRLFASQGTVIMTREARRLMELNKNANEAVDSETFLTKTEMLCLRRVTEGLKLVHKGQDFVKDVLSRVITYEVYNAFEYVPSKHWEDSLSCYYIINGAVEVTYDLRETKSRAVYQANIIYSHGTGEYVGLISPEGPSEDLAPPATIYTKELTQLIRIDRKRFHILMVKARMLIDKRKRDFIASHSFLTHVAADVKDKIVHKLSIQDYPANSILLSQGELTENLFIVMSGRCQTYREVYIPEVDRDVLFYLTSREPDDFFGEECVLDKRISVCTVVTATSSTIMKLHKSALQTVNRERLARFIECARHEFPDDEDLRNRGYRDSLWNRYKHCEVKDSLREAGKMHYLSKQEAIVVHERPPDEKEQYTENMWRFIMKGSQYEPLRVRSAYTRKPQYALPRRPHTATFISQIPPAQQEPLDPHDEDQKSEESSESETMSLPEKPVKPKLTVKPVLKAMESKESLIKIMEDQVEVPAHLKQAWKEEDSQDSQNFMKNGVMVTMRSEDIVRKAKALADTYADKWNVNTTNEYLEDWDTVLHTENIDAKTKIAVNKMRMKDLKRRLTDLQKRRDVSRQTRKKNNEVKSTVQHEATTEIKSTLSDYNDSTAKAPTWRSEYKTEAVLSDIEEDADSLPMYKMTHERRRLLKSWDSNGWSQLGDIVQSRGADGRTETTGLDEVTDREIEELDD